MACPLIFKLFSPIQGKNLRLKGSRELGVQGRGGWNEESPLKEVKAKGVLKGLEQSGCGGISWKRLHY